jgi:hypothetical protein
MCIRDSPHERREAFDQYPPYPWTEWSASFDGIEIWNHMSEWMEGLKPENRFRRAVHPLASVTAPPKETLDLWDRLNLSRKVVALGGVDAHAHKVNLLGLSLKIFPYKVCFRSIRNHLLLPEPIDVSKPIEREREKIYDALREGRAFISNAYLGAAKGFRFSAVHQGKEYEMGSSAPLSAEPIHFDVQVPRLATIRLIHNGQLAVERQSDNLSFAMGERGVYRVECYLNGKAWIFSNAIRFIEPA